jgi:molybdenum cofactor synthesis domain-containing protein
MGKIVAVCSSKKKGTANTPGQSALLIENHGMENDAHAGNGHRQISLLSHEKIMDFRARGALVPYGSFGENLVVTEIDFATLPVGTRLSCGEVLLEISQIGKECHDRCQIYHSMGECIMPTQGVFATVLNGGLIREGDTMTVVDARQSQTKTNGYKAAILTISDKGHAGKREDVSGATLKNLVETAGYQVVHYAVLPDEKEIIAAELSRLADANAAELILTTGGTGFSKRDVTPEATLAVVERLCPGIPEAMRSTSLQKTKRAMLTRSVAGLRGNSLIINLPGSPKAVSECLACILDQVEHGLDILTGTSGECG